MRNKKFIAFATVVLFVCQFVLVTSLAAQLPNPKLFSLRPCGGKAGTQFEITIRGADTDEGTSLIFSHAGITAKPKQTAAQEFVPAKPISNVFVVNIAANVPPGMYDVRFLGRFGISNPRRFVVSNENESASDGQNRSINSAKFLPLNEVHTGQVDASQVDYFKFRLDAKQTVTIECLTKSIDSRLDPAIEIYDLEGNQLKALPAHEHGDGFLSFTAPFASQFICAVRDFTFTGGADHFYRLRIHAAPHIVSASPLCLPSQGETNVKFIGYNLPGGQPSGIPSADPNLQVAMVKIKTPLAENNNTASTDPVSINLNGRDIHLTNNGKRSRPFTMYLSDHPIQIESANNNQFNQPQAITIPCDLSAKFYPRNDVDWFEFDAKAGQIFTVDLISQRMEKYSDPTLEIHSVTKSADGKVTSKRLHFIDDAGDRNARVKTNFDFSSDDPTLRFAVPADGKYRVGCANQFSAFDDITSNYRLVIRPEKPRCLLVVEPKLARLANGNQVLMSAATVRPGATCKLLLKVERREGFNSKLNIGVKGLPAGVTARPTILAQNQSVIPLIFQAAENAAAWQGPIEIVATIEGTQTKIDAAIGSVVLETQNRTITPAAFRVSNTLEFAVSTAQSTPLTVELGADQIYETARGGKINIPVKLLRRHGFNAEVKLGAETLPGQFKPPQLAIPANKSDGNYAMTINKDVPVNDFTFCLGGDIKHKIVRNPFAITQAENEQKVIVAKLGEFNTMLKPATDKLNAAKAAVTAETNKVNAEKAKITAAENDLKAKQAMLATKTNELKSAQAALAKNAADVGLKKGVETKTIELNAAKKAANNATTNVTNIKKAVGELEKVLAIKTAAQTAAQNEFNTIQAKVNRLNELKKAADTNVANVKKANPPRDTTYRVHSTTARIRIHQTPIEFKLPPQVPPSNPGKDLPLNIALTRKFGFAADVQFSLVLPKGLGNISAAPLVLKPDQPNGMMTLKLQANAPKGTHACKILAKGKFGAVDFAKELPFNLVVQ